MFKRSIFLFLVLFISISASASASVQGIGGEGTLKYVEMMDNGYVQLSLSEGFAFHGNITCKNKDRVVFEPNEKINQKLSVALTALTAGKKVFLWTSGKCWNSNWGPQFPIMENIGIHQ